MLGSHCLTIDNTQITLDRGMGGGRLVQLDFSAAFDRVSHCGLLYKLRSIGIGRQFLPIVSVFVIDRRQCMRLDGKVSKSVDLVSEALFQLGPLLFILYTSELFHIVGKHVVGSYLCSYS